MKPDIGLQDKDKALRSSANLRSKQSCSANSQEKGWTEAQRCTREHRPLGHTVSLSQGWVDGYIAFKSSLKNVNVVLEKWFSQ